MSTTTTELDVHTGELTTDGPSTDLTHRAAPASSLAIRSDQRTFEEAQLEALGLQDAPRGDVAVFFHQCVKSGLDPFARQLYMLGRQQNENVNGTWQKVTKYTIQGAIDGLRLVAHRAAQRSGETFSVGDALWCGPDGQWRDVWVGDGYPHAAKFTVYRNGQPFSAVAHFHEYKGTKYGGDLNKMWSEKPAVMIAKCAEALALRKAWPQDLSGIYTPEEMAAADAPSDPRSAPQVANARQDRPALTGPQAAPQGPPTEVIRELIRGLDALEVPPADRGVYVAQAIGREVAGLEVLTDVDVAKLFTAINGDYQALNAKRGQAPQPDPAGEATTPQQ